MDFLIGFVFWLKIASLVYEGESQKIADSLDQAPIHKVQNLSSEALRFEMISDGFDIAFYIGIAIVIGLITFKL